MQASFDIYLFKGWLIETKKVSRSTAKTYAADVSKFERFLEGKEADASNISDLLEHYFESQDLALNYANRIRSALLQFFSYPKVDAEMQRAGAAWLKTNIALFNGPSENLDVSHVAQLVRAAAETSRDIHRVRNAALVAYLYATGLHVEEVLNETPGFFPHQLSGQFSDEESHVHFTEEPRPLHPNAKTALYYWIEERERLPGLNQRGAQSHLWTNVVLDPTSKRLGSQMSVKSVARLFENLSRHVGFDPPVTANDLREFFLRQAGPGTTTSLLTEASNETACWTAKYEGEEVRADIQSVFDRVKPIPQLENILEESRWQQQARPHQLTFEHAKALIRGALRERGLFKSVRGVAFVGFLLGTGYYLTEATALKHKQLRLSNDISFVVLDHRKEPTAVPLSDLALAALRAWLSVAPAAPFAKSKNEGETENAGLVWWFDPKGRGDKDAHAWTLLDRLSKKGGLDFTVTAYDLRALFERSVSVGTYTNRVLETDNHAFFSDHVQDIDADRVAVDAQAYESLRVMREELAGSKELKEFTAWYQTVLKTEF